MVACMGSGNGALRAGAAKGTCLAKAARQLSMQHLFTSYGVYDLGGALLWGPYYTL